MSLKRISRDEFYPYHEFTDDEFERAAEIPDDIVTRCERAIEEFRACQKILGEYWVNANVQSPKNKPRIVLLPPGVSYETAQAVMDSTEQAEPGNSE